MKKFTRPLLMLAVSAGLVLSGTAAAQAAAPAAPVVAPVVAASPSDGSSGGSSGGGGICPSCCEAAKTLHWTAEWVLDALHLQPIFSLIDEPIIHPILWSPLNYVLGGCGVDSHPAGLG